MTKYNNVINKSRFGSAVLICLVSGVMASCTTTPKPAKNIHYECDRGTHLNVTFVEKGATTVRGGRNSIPRYEIKNVAANVTLADDIIITLPVQKVASGFMYSNGKYSLRGEGDEAMWSVGRMLAEHCVIKP